MYYIIESKNNINKMESKTKYPIMETAVENEVNILGESFLCVLFSTI